MVYQQCHRWAAKLARNRFVLIFLTSFASVLLTQIIDARGHITLDMLANSWYAAVVIVAVAIFPTVQKYQKEKNAGG